MREFVNAFIIALLLARNLPVIAFRGLRIPSNSPYHYLLMSKRSSVTKIDGKDATNDNVTTPSPKKTKLDGVVIDRDLIVPKDFGDMPTIKIISWNVAGLRGTLKNR